MGSILTPITFPYQFLFRYYSITIFDSMNYRLKIIKIRKSTKEFNDKCNYNYLSDCIETILTPERQLALF